MKPLRPVVEDDTSFELKANADLPGMANLRINCLVSIPTGIRILALIDAEEGKLPKSGDAKPAERPRAPTGRRVRATLD